MSISYIYTNDQLRPFQSESELGLFESRIASVEDEHMRRLPELRENFQEFSQCIKKAGCDFQKILSKRDDILNKNWSYMYRRLTIEQDWGEARNTAIYHPNVSG